MPKKGVINNPKGRPKTRPDTRALSFRVELEVFDQVDLYCLKHKINRSDLLSGIFNEFYKNSIEPDTPPKSD